MGREGDSDIHATCFGVEGEMGGMEREGDSDIHAGFRGGGVLVGDGLQAVCDVHATCDL